MKMSAIDKSWNPDTGNLKWSVGQDKYHAKVNPQLTSVTCTKNGAELGTYKIKDSRDGYSLIDKDNKVHVVKGGGTLVELIIQTCSGLEPKMRSLASNMKPKYDEATSTLSWETDGDKFKFVYKGLAKAKGTAFKNGKNIGDIAVAYDNRRRRFAATILEKLAVKFPLFYGAKKHDVVIDAVLTLDSELDANVADEEKQNPNYKFNETKASVNSMSKLRVYQTTAASKKVTAAIFKAPKHAKIHRDIMINLKSLLPGSKWETNEEVQYPDKNDDNDNAWDSSVFYKGVVILLEDGRYTYVMYEAVNKLKAAYEKLEDELASENLYVAFPYEDNSARILLASKKIIEETAKIKKIMNEVQTALVKAIRMAKK